MQPEWVSLTLARSPLEPADGAGVCDALRDVELLANVVDDGFSGRRPLGEALARYGQLREAATLPDVHMNLAAAHLQPPAPDYEARAPRAVMPPRRAHTFSMVKGHRPPPSYNEASGLTGTRRYTTIPPAWLNR